MTDAATNEPTGIHRTYLHPDGIKRERKMLGRQGVVRLSPDEDLTMGLGIAEGIETGLRILLSGWSPAWCATSGGGIARFPVLSGIESLTIFVDDDETGMKAAHESAERWSAAGREVRIAHPKDAFNGR
jgi:putative DNA primase/helicase